MTETTLTLETITERRALYEAWEHAVERHTAALVDSDDATSPTVRRASSKCDSTYSRAAGGLMEIAAALLDAAEAGVRAREADRDVHTLVHTIIAEFPDAFGDGEEVTAGQAAERLRAACEAQRAERDRLAEEHKRLREAAAGLVTSLDYYGEGDAPVVERLRAALEPQP